mgnify:CR=1 FL=1
MDFFTDRKIIPILMCGGSGSRLWPMSRKSLPKQFLKCNPSSTFSFLQDTFLRLKKIKNIEEPILICNEEHRFITAEQMREIDVKPKSIILEPYAKNTAPAIALGTIKANTFEENPIVLVLPADHSISDIDQFTKTIEKGIKYAEEGKIVTYGITPKSPETGFGYIEAELNLDYENPNGIKINSFIEKPNKEKAEQFINSRKYLWNSGIFLMKAKTALEQFALFVPEVLSICNSCIQKSSKDLEFLRIDKNNFHNCPDVSFDIGIMEKTELGIVIPLDIEWSDVGSWDSIWNISKKDNSGNSIVGNVLSDSIKNCYLRSENKLIVGIDIENIIAVETSDAVLIVKKESSQKVKNIVEKMKNKNILEATQHKKVFRPWGSYISIADGKGWQVKTITVKPRACLSLQKHNFRTEHWVVVSGEALVEIENNKKILSVNQSIYIPMGYKHRLSNLKDKPLIIIEVQSGTYLGEDDIIRFEDAYGRKN